MPVPEPLPLSVAIVCKDSARNIGAVLDSVSGWAAEIVAVDSGSTDATLDILAEHSARVIRSDWLGHVKTKQKALDACEQAWVLCLDSDEPVEPDLRASIEELVRADDQGNSPEVAGAMVNRKIWYRGRFLDHAWQPEWRLRLVRRGAARWAGLDPHDKLEVTGGGRVVKLGGTLRHDSFVSFADQLAKDVGYARMMAGNLHDAGKRGSRLRCVTSPIGAFCKQMVVKQAWRDGRAGWLAALSTAAATLHKHAVLLELSQEGAEGEGSQEG